MNIVQGNFLVEKIKSDPLNLLVNTSVGSEKKFFVLTIVVGTFFIRRKMAKRNNFNIKAYLVIGPENTKGRDVIEIIEDAIRAGFTFIQIRSKEASARDLIDISLRASDLIDKMGKRDEVALVVNDRLDVILAARDCGANIDGIHIGQSDIPVDTCRKYLD